MNKTHCTADLNGLVVVFPLDQSSNATFTKSQQAANKIKEILAAHGQTQTILKLPSGKPVCDNGVYVSVSHSGKLIAVAVANREIGVDIQCKTEVNRSAIALKFFTEREQNSIAEAQNCEDAFFALWCKKEALWKSLKDQPTTVRTVETDGVAFTEKTFVFDGEKYYLAVTNHAEIVTEGF